MPARLRSACLLLSAIAAASAPSAARPQDSVLEPPAATTQPPPPVAPTLDADLDPGEDGAIARRLRSTYATIDGLAPVQVGVTAGVVVLTGEVSTQALRQQAARLAANVRGVAEVENRVEVAQDLEGRLKPALRRLDRLWTDIVRLLPVLLLGAAIMAAAVTLGRLLARWKGLYRRISDNAFIAGLLSQVVQTALLLAGLALTILLLDATGLFNTLLGAAGIVGLALGFALRDTVENYIASVLLSLRRPFEPFDYVRIGDHEGMVIRLTSRATVLMNLDGNQIRIPNAMVFKGLIVNITRRRQRRFTFTLGIAPDEDLGRAQRVAVEALAQVDGVLAEPAPAALYESVGESAVNLIVAGWMDQTSHDFLRVRSEAIRVVLTQWARPTSIFPNRRSACGGRLRRCGSRPNPSRLSPPAATAPSTGRSSRNAATARIGSTLRVARSSAPASPPDLAAGAGLRQWPAGLKSKTRNESRSWEEARSVRPCLIAMLMLAVAACQRGGAPVPASADQASPPTYLERSMLGADADDPYFLDRFRRCAAFGSYTYCQAEMYGGLPQ